MSLALTLPTHNCYAILPAAGIGERMGSDCPKQYLLANNGKTILENAIAPFLSHPKILSIVVALHPEDKHFQTLSIALHKKVYTCLGGKTRADSVRSAIAYLTLSKSPKPSDWLLVHDAARPYLQPSDLDNLLTRVEPDTVGGILVRPATDTIKRRIVGGIESRWQTLDRRELVHALTPQMFRFGILKPALEQACAQGMRVTDEAQAIENLGLPYQCIPAYTANPKITFPSDL